MKVKADSKMVGFHIEKTLFERFKAYCIKQRIPMGSVVSELIKKELKEKTIKQKEK